MKGFIWRTGWCLQRLCLVPPAPGKPAFLAGKKHLLTRFPAEQRNPAWGPFFALGVRWLISSEQTRTVMAATAWVLHLQHSLVTGNLPCHRNTALWEHVSFHPGNDLGSAFTPDCFQLSFKNNTQEITSVHDPQTLRRGRKTAGSHLRNSNASPPSNCTVLEAVNDLAQALACELRSLPEPSLCTQSPVHPSTLILLRKHKELVPQRTAIWWLWSAHSCKVN